ncbi:MAG: TetR/AcrR family transcriptional regulator [Chlorogloeopsis fritschii C42_A2020_084]|uniref:TetR/AcrR family transcriptional regulator n=1 Tax=Chlorogloeopsis fritschii TaxID=1124 RepID=UPI001A1033D0|nr:TetR/AcrR family transcriptional regulator [Chlorogloeopsis fritschii]MBF2004105.1 TetR/AcrR family transcriptional regulator [Chlorogloeopsis fritschii C42_A2020_084]
MNLKDTRTQILDAAQELIQRLGVNAISYQDISVAVGIRKASIHHHFPTKDDLIATLLDRYNAYFLQLVDNIIAMPIPADEKLRRYCGLFEATLSSGNHDKACLCGMLGAELATLKNPLVERVAVFYRNNEERLATILNEGRNTGVFGFPGDVKAMATLIFSLLEGGILIVRASGGVEQYRAVIEQLMELVKG